MTAAPVARPDEGPILREWWWWAYSLGEDRPQVPAWALEPEAEPDQAYWPGPDLLEGADTGERRPWPCGSTERLETMPYGDMVGDCRGEKAWDYVLASTFAPVRHDPVNAYNDHRTYPSARCLFPVHAFTRTDGRLGHLDPDALTTVDLGRSEARQPALILAGRYTRVPASYGWMRGSLVGLELGIVLRQLAVAARLHGLSLDLTPPGPDWADTLAELPLQDPGAWSPPWTLSAAADPVRAFRRSTLAERPRTAPLDDERGLQNLAEVLGANPVGGSSGPLGCGIPAVTAPAVAPAWSEVLWRRSSGRMPRGLHGFAFAPARVARTAIEDAVSWSRLPPPDGLLAAAHEAITARVVLQGVDGLDDGLYEVGPEGPLLLRRAGTGIARAVEARYGYPRSQGVGCDLGNATALWFLGVRPRALAQRSGPSAWTAAQVAAGWVVQGLCLSAAAHGLVARPMRAFSEAAIQDLVGLQPDEVLSIAVCVGTELQPGTHQLDLRT